MNLDWVKIVLVMALKQECPPCLERVPLLTLAALEAKDYRGLNTQSQGLLCLVSGVGADAAQRCMDWVRTHIRPILLVNIGSCGSQDPCLRDTLISPCLLSHSAQDQTYSSVGCFPFLGGEAVRPITQGISVESFSEAHRADCIDMEAYWLAKGCHEQHIPFCCVKYVSDANTQTDLRQLPQAFERLRARMEDLLSGLFVRPVHDVSVIIPSYNRASFLKRSIESVLDQQLKVECIVVDDGSTDETSTLLDHYRTRIRVLRHDENKGVSAARNTGIRAATGNWLMFLDSDDEWLPEKIEAQCAYSRAYPFFSLLQSQERWIRHDKALAQKAYHQKKEGFIWELCLARCLISPSSVMIDRRLFDDVSFDESLPACEDYDLWLHFSRRYLLGLEPSISLIKYAGHADQLSFATPVLDRYRLASLSKHLDADWHPVFRKKLSEMSHYKEAIVRKGAMKRRLKQSDGD